MTKLIDKSMNYLSDDMVDDHVALLDFSDAVKGEIGDISYIGDDMPGTIPYWLKTGSKSSARRDYMSDRRPRKRAKGRHHFSARPVPPTPCDKVLADVARYSPDVRTFDVLTVRDLLIRPHTVYAVSRVLGSRHRAMVALHALVATEELIYDGKPLHSQTWVSL